MSKRFGRNQKRALRAMVAAAEAAALNRLQMAERSRMEVKYLREELDEAKDIAGQMSVIFPATVTSGGMVKPYLTLADDRVNSLSERIELVGEMVCRTFTLPVFTAHIDDDRLYDAKHVTVEFDGQRYGYALSRSAIASTPEPLLCRRIADQLARIIAAELKQVRRR